MMCMNSCSIMQKDARRIPQTDFDVHHPWSMQARAHLLQHKKGCQAYKVMLQSTFSGCRKHDAKQHGREQTQLHC